MICKKTGQICYQSEMTDLDEIPAEAYGSDSWVEVPHQNDLGLGRDLVFEFVAEHLPSDYYRLQMIFSKRGAYSGYKDLLDRRGLLQKWYDFENAKQQEAIRQWCAENEIEVTD